MSIFGSPRAALSLYFRRRAVARQVRRELGAMSDAELNDLGLSHASVSRIAREAAAEVH